MIERELDKWVKKYAKGEKEYFDLIYENTKGLVYISIRTIIKKHEIIEDLMQDTYIQVIKHLDSYKIGSNFNAWICQIARNLAINYYRKHKNEELVGEEIFAIFESKGESKLSYYLSLLEGIEKEVVIYHLIYNMKFETIAQIIDEPRSTTFYIYKKALEKIKKQVNK